MIRKSEALLTFVFACFILILAFTQPGCIIDPSGLGPGPCEELDPDFEGCFADTTPDWTIMAPRYFIRIETLCSQLTGYGWGGIAPYTFEGRIERPGHAILWAKVPGDPVDSERWVIEAEHTITDHLILSVVRMTYPDDRPPSSDLTFVLYPVDCPP